MKKIAVLASGSGSNAEKIFEYFQNHSEIEVVALFTNNPDAFVVQRADNFEIPTIVFNKSEFYESDDVINRLQKFQVNLIVLAGFLWLIPDTLIQAFPEKIINIHPALLPKFGGKGMYGMNVHNSVYTAKEKETGISIHVVNENYDEGKVIFQSKFKIKEEDTPETIAFRVRQLEHANFSKVIEKLLLDG